MKTSGWPNEARLTGLCLACGSLLFLVAAFMPLWDSSGNSVYMMPARQSFAFILNNSGLWGWTSALFAAAALITLFGLAMLTDLMRDTAGRLWSQLGLLAFSLGVLLWTVEMGFRLSLGSWGSSAASDPSALDLFVRLSSWAQTLFVVDITLVLCALVAYGAAMLAGRRLPGWTGWAAIAFGALGLAMLIATGDVAPFIAYVPLLAIGVRLVARPMRGARYSRMEEDKGILGDTPKPPAGEVPLHPLS